MHFTHKRPQHHPSCPARLDRHGHCVGCAVPRTADIMALDVLATAAIAKADYVARAISHGISGRVARAARRG